jgi:hypothetical protein
MDTRTIERFVSRDEVCSASFQGVFSRDTLPRNQRLLIYNTDQLYKARQHWIAIYVDESRRGGFFDSFERPPYRDFEQYMNKHCSSWTYNRRQLQSLISSFCGYYCCFYCMLTSRGKSINGILSVISPGILVLIILFIILCVIKVCET